MLGTLVKRVKDWERRVSWSFGDDISTPEGRRAAARHFQLVDHAFLRVWWTNLGKVAPGVWRSNQPSPARVARYAEMGIRSIIYLRGPARWSYLLFEEEACARHGIALHIRHLAARSLVPRENVLALLDLFETVEAPVLMHCKSGADRAGLAAALWLMHMEGATVARAQQELSWRYLHLRNSPTGVLGHMLDHYEADRRATGIGLRAWIADRYDPPAIMESWRQRRGAGEVRA